MSPIHKGKKRDYYEILQVTRTATDEELKKAYRKLAVQHHPDRNPGNKESEDAFKEINEAYQVLSDPQKRSTFDRFGHAGLGAQGAGGFEQGFGGASFQDIFDNIFGDIFGQGGPGGGPVGVDLRYHLELTFEEAALGTEKKITFEKESPCATCSGNGAKPGTKPKTCRTCQGAGQIRFNQGFFTLSRTCTTCSGRGTIIEEKCGTCRGRGRTKQPTTVTVKVPAGIDGEQRLRVRGEGEVGEGTGRPGDLYVQVSVAEHPLFRRDGEHVILDFPITFVQAALGTEVQVPTLAGLSLLKISAGTQSGDIKRLKGKGIARLNGSGFGDQVVRILVETPTKLSARQRELLSDFDKEDSKDSHPTIASFVQKFKTLFDK